MGNSLEYADNGADGYPENRGDALQQEKTRKRIDWMLSQQIGTKALDIGSSQGALPILLAKQGVAVCAVEKEGEPVAHARMLIEQELPEIKSKIELRVGEFCQSDLKGEKFNTVYIGEALQYAEKPYVIIKLISEYVSCDGRLVIATSYGCFQHHDHCQIQKMTVSNLINVLSGEFEIKEMVIVDSYIHICFEKSKRNVTKININSILADIESYYLEQQLLYDDLYLSKNRLINHLSLKNDELLEKIEKQKKELDNLIRINSGQSVRLRKMQDGVKIIEESKTYRLGKEIVGACNQPYPNMFRLPFRLWELVLSAAVKRKLKKLISLTLKYGRNQLVLNDYKPLKLHRKPALPVAAILDEFTEHCFKSEWNLELLNRKKWRKQLNDTNPAFVFIESAWRGNGGQWKYTLTQYEGLADNPLKELLEYCKLNKIPTVYWGKEDPPNFEVFIDSAKHFDYIFTTDSDCIPRYKAICNHERVYALPFAAQPILHNPALRMNDGEREIAFGGGWYGDKHPNRHKFLPMLLDATLDANKKLTIFDRFSDINSDVNSKHRYPDRYSPYLRDKISYQQMLSAYRAFPVFLNVNSVVESPSMFSRRVFELLACGTNVISSPSDGMNNMLNGFVSVVESKEDGVQAVKSLLDNPEEAERKAHRAYRHVMLHHTYENRANYVEKQVLNDAKDCSFSPPVSVVLTTNRPSHLKFAIDNFRRQKYTNKELIIVLNNNKFDEINVEKAVTALDNVKIFSIPEEKTLATCLNHVLQFVEGRYWAKFDDDDIYGENYLIDSLLPFKYTDADIVGKRCYYAFLKEENKLYVRNANKQHQYTQIVCGGTLVVNSDVKKEIKFNEQKIRGCDTEFLKQSLNAGMLVYSADKYNFIQVRENNSSQHTWDIDMKLFKKSCKFVTDGLDKNKVFV